MEQKVQTNIRHYIGFQTFISLLLWVPIFYQFQREIGLSDQDFFNIQYWYYLIFIICEIPTGLLSDLIGHRNCVRLGGGLMMLANLLPIILANFYGMFIHFALIALARALLSGSASAWIYESLKEQKQIELYHQVEGKARSYALVARIAGWSVVGFLMKLHLNLPYWITALTTGIAFLLSLQFAPTPPVARTSFRWLSFFKSFKISTRLLLLILQGAGLFILARLFLVNFYQPLLRYHGFEVGSFGLIMAGMTLLEAFTSHHSHKLSQKLNHQTGIFILTAIVCLGAIWATIGSSLQVYLGLAIFALGSGVAFPFQKKIINSEIKDPLRRATLLSLESIIQRLLCALILTAAGPLIAAGKIEEYLVSSSLLLLALVCGTAFLLKRTSAS